MQHPGRCALFVLSEIEVAEVEGTPAPSDGTVRVLLPWEPNRSGELRPLVYKYVLPSAGR